MPRVVRSIVPMSARSPLGVKGPLRYFAGDGATGGSISQSPPWIRPRPAVSHGSGPRFCARQDDPLAQRPRGISQTGRTAVGRKQVPAIAGIRPWAGSAGMADLHRPPPDRRAWAVGQPVSRQLRRGDLDSFRVTGPHLGRSDPPLLLLATCGHAPSRTRRHVAVPGSQAASSAGTQALSTGSRTRLSAADGARCLTNCRVPDALVPAPQAAGGVQTRAPGLTWPIASRRWRKPGVVWIQIRRPSLSCTHPGIAHPKAPTLSMSSTRADPPRRPR